MPVTVAASPRIYSVRAHAQLENAYVFIQAVHTCTFPGHVRETIQRQGKGKAGVLARVRAVSPLRRCCVTFVRLSVVLIL